MSSTVDASTSTSFTAPPADRSENMQNLTIPPRSSSHNPPTRPPHPSTLLSPLRIPSPARSDASTPPPLYTIPSYEAYRDLASKNTYTPPPPPPRVLLRSLFILRCILDFQLLTFSCVIFISGILSLFTTVFITHNYSATSIFVTFLIATTIFVPLTERYLVTKTYKFDYFGFEESADIPECVMSFLWGCVLLMSLFTVVLGFGMGGGEWEESWWSVGWDGAGLSVLYLAGSGVATLGRWICARWYGIEEGYGRLRLDDDDDRV